MSRSDTVIISLANETTASQFLYAVSPAVARIVCDLSPEKVSAAMPQQSPYGLGYEQVAYAMALVQLAKNLGIGDADISVVPLSVPEVVFESGWRDRSDDENAHGTRNVESVDRLFPQHVCLNVEEIRKTCREPENVCELSQLLCATAFFRSRDGNSPYVAPYGFGIGTGLMDGGQFFVTVYDAAGCGYSPDEEEDTFATYWIYGRNAPHREIVLTRIHVGHGLREAEDCRAKTSGIAWEEWAEKQAFETWRQLIGKA